MKYRNLPFAPLKIDPAFGVSGNFATLARDLEDVLVGLKGDKEFARIMKALGAIAHGAEDPGGFARALKLMKKCGPHGDHGDFQDALAKIQLAFLGNMYHPSGNSNMRALMPNENTDVMR